MVAIDCFWQIREDDSGKDFICAVEDVADYKTDVLHVILHNYMHIIYDSSDKHVSNIEQISIDCDYVDVKKTNDNKRIIMCVVL
ncbi:MAG: hypothetical protein QXW20_08375 [Ignisphaera sp.]